MLFARGNVIRAKRNTIRGKTEYYSRNAWNENPRDAFWEESVTIENAPHNESHYFRSGEIQTVDTLIH